MTLRQVVVDEQADTVRTIFEQFITSTNCSRIAKELNDKGVPAFAGGIWHPLTVRRILQNETYTGRTVYRRTRVEKSRDLRNGGSVRRVRSQPESDRRCGEGLRARQRRDIRPYKRFFCTEAPIRM